MGDGVGNAVDDRAGSATGDGPGLGRRGILGLVGTVLVPTAGCTDALLGGGGADPGALAADLPADTGVLSHVEDDVFTDPEMQRMMDQMASQENQELGVDLDEVMAAYARRLGLDFDSFDAAVAFCPSMQAYADGQLGAVIDAGWDESTFIEAMERATGATFGPHEFAGQEVLYGPTSQPPGGGVGYAGVLGSGRYVVGPETRVRAALGVQYRQDPAIGGAVREAYRIADGHSITVVELPEDWVTRAPGDVTSMAPIDTIDTELLESIAVLGYNYWTPVGQYAWRLRLFVDDGSRVQDVATAVETLLAAARERIDDPDVTAEVGAISVETRDNRVVLTHRITPDRYAELLERYAESD